MSEHKDRPSCGQALRAIHGEPGMSVNYCVNFLPRPNGQYGNQLCAKPIKLYVVLYGRSEP